MSLVTLSFLKKLNFSISNLRGFSFIIIISYSIKKPKFQLSIPREKKQLCPGDRNLVFTDHKKIQFRKIEKSKNQVSL